ncbi:hypothetical protein U1Q18_030186, partial [Sarracenia purpurea var. burkii]
MEYERTRSRIVIASSIRSWGWGFQERFKEKSANGRKTLISVKIVRRGWEARGLIREGLSRQMKVKKCSEPLAPPRHNDVHIENGTLTET